MKLSIIELRDMVAQAVRQTIREAKKAKLPAERSEESVLAQRDRHVRGLPGYAHGNVLDMSKPLGKRNKVKRQGASNIGNWTSESVDAGPSDGQRVYAIVDVLEAAGIRGRAAGALANRIFERLRRLDSVQEAAVRKLVGMVVDEEVRVADRR